MIETKRRKLHDSWGSSGALLPCNEANYRVSKSPSILSVGFDVRAKMKSRLSLTLQVLHPNLILEILNFLDVRTIERKFVQVSTELRRFILTYLDRVKVLNVISENCLGNNDSLWCSTILGLKPTGLKVLTEFNLTLSTLSTAAMMTLQHLEMRSLRKIRWCLTLEKSAKSYYGILFSKLLRTTRSTLEKMELTIDSSDFFDSPSGLSKLFQPDILEDLALKDFSLVVKGPAICVENFLEIPAASKFLEKLSLNLGMQVSRSLRFPECRFRALKELHVETPRGTPSIVAGIASILTTHQKSLRNLTLSMNLVETLGLPTDQKFSELRSMKLINFDWKGSFGPSLGSPLLRHRHHHSYSHHAFEGLRLSNQSRSSYLAKQKPLSTLSLPDLIIRVMKKCPVLEEIAAPVDLPDEDEYLSFFEELLSTFHTIRKLNLVPFRVTSRAAQKVAQMICNRILEGSSGASSLQLQQVCWVPVRSFLENTTVKYHFDLSALDQVVKPESRCSSALLFLEALFQSSFLKNESVKRVTFADNVCQGLMRTSSKSDRPEERLSFSKYSYILDRDYLSGESANDEGYFLKTFDFSNYTLFSEIQTLIVLTFVKDNRRIETLRIGDFHLLVDTSLILSFLTSMTSVSSLEVATSTIENSIAEEIFQMTFKIKSGISTSAALREENEIGTFLSQLKKIKLLENQMVIDYSRNSIEDVLTLATLPTQELYSSQDPHLQKALSRFFLTGQADEIVCSNMLGDFEDLAMLINCMHSNPRATVTKFINSNFMLWKDVGDQPSGGALDGSKVTNDYLKASLAWKAATTSVNHWKQLRYFWFSYHNVRKSNLHLCEIDSSVTGDPCMKSHDITTGSTHTCPNCLFLLKKLLQNLSDEIQIFHLDLNVVIDMDDLVTLYLSELVTKKPALRSLGVLDISAYKSLKIIRKAPRLVSDRFDPYRALNVDNTSNFLYIYILLKEMFDLTSSDLHDGNKCFQGVLPSLEKSPFSPVCTNPRRLIEEFFWEALIWCQFQRDQDHVTATLLRPVSKDRIDFLAAFAKASPISSFLIYDHLKNPYYC